MSVTKQKSASVSQRRAKERKDERVRRTRSRIDAAFIELLHRRAYGNIRVSDITKKACVGRPTFYAHYATKDDLLRSQFERLVVPMVAITPGDPLAIDATRFFAHICASPHIYKALMGPNSGTAPRVVRDCLEARFRNALAAAEAGSSSLRQAATARFLASTLTVIVECWLEQGARDGPQQVQTLFANLISPALGKMK